MDDKIRRRMQLNCLYEMFGDRIEENVIYIVYSENDGRIDTTIDQLMSISSCSFTGHHFEKQSQQQATRPLVTATTNTNSNLTTPKVSASNDKTQDSGYATDLIKAGAATKIDDDVSADGDECLSIDERIERLQKSIDDILMEKRTCHDKSSQYLSKKMFPVTSYYSEMAGQLHRMIERKTTQLVDLLLLKSQDANSIDLHGLNPIQAKLVVAELLRIREEKLLIDKQGKASIDIITGWGKHSAAFNQHRVKPTIISLLREKGVEFYKLNKGALRVTIRRC